MRHTIFVPLSFGADERMMYSIIPHGFTVRLRNKLGEVTSKSILNAALRRANVIMANVIKDSSHNGYETNNINRSLARHVGTVAYRRFKNDITNAQRSQTYRNARVLLNTRPNNKRGNEFHGNYEFNTGVLVTYSAPMKSPRI